MPSIPAYAAAPVCLMQNGAPDSTGAQLMKQSVLVGIGAVVLAVAASSPATAFAQETQLDLHGNYSTGTSTHTRAWGAGVAAQSTFGGKSAPIKASLSPGFDYLKQEKGGPSQSTVSLDASLQPGGSSTVTPYAGMSASSNWSGGSGKMWQGAKLGLEAIGGAQFKLGASGASVKAEERFGYVKSQEHTLTTRLGFLVAF